MSNKKRIYNRIRKIEIKQFKKGIRNFIVASKKATFASNHMVDAFKYFTAGIEKWKRSIPIVVEFDYGIDLGKSFTTEKSIFENVPAKYKIPFIELIKVGFSEEEALHTLKETYNF